MFFSEFNYLCRRFKLKSYTWKKVAFGTFNNYLYWLTPQPAINEITLGIPLAINEDYSDTFNTLFQQLTLSYPSIRKMSYSRKILTLHIGLIEKNHLNSASDLIRYRIIFFKFFFNLITNFFTRKKSYLLIYNILSHILSIATVTQTTSCCSICHNSYRLDPILLGNNILYCCPKCSTKASINYIEKLKIQTTNPSNLKILLGTLLFSIPGVCLYCLLAIYNDALAPITSFTISIGGLYGYTKFGGKKNYTSVIFPFLISFILILIASVFSTGVSIYQHTSPLLSYREMIRLIPNYKNELNTLLLLAYVKLNCLYFGLFSLPIFYKSFKEIHTMRTTQYITLN